jgi:transposase
MKNDNTGSKTTFTSLVVRKAYTYYLKGLNAAEIGKLLDVSARTVQRYIKDNDFKEHANPPTIEQKTHDLYVKGLTYRQIAKAIGKSRTSVYYYLKRMKDASITDET